MGQDIRFFSEKTFLMIPLREGMCTSSKASIYADLFFLSLLSISVISGRWENDTERLGVLLNIYSQLSLSRLRLSRITAYLEEKIWSLF